jgi:hypothetical protein
VTVGRANIPSHVKVYIFSRILQQFPPDGNGILRNALLSTRSHLLMGGGGKQKAELPDQQEMDGHCFTIILGNDDTIICIFHFSLKSSVNDFGIFCTFTYFMIFAYFQNTIHKLYFFVCLHF